LNNIVPSEHQSKASGIGNPLRQGRDRSRRQKSHPILLWLVTSTATTAYGRKYYWTRLQRFPVVQVLNYTTAWAEAQRLPLKNP